MLEAVLILLGGFLGSLPFGAWLTRLATGKNVQQEGSGNIGATNVARVAGKRLGVAVLLLDAAKGALPVWLSTRVLPDVPWLHAAVGAAAVLNHIFPFWLGFKGGKGIATAAGVLAVLVPLAAAAGALVYALLLLVFRISSVGSLAATLTATVVAHTGSAPRPYAILTGTLLVMMFFTHRANLQRLWKQTENKL